MNVPIVRLICGEKKMRTSDVDGVPDRELDAYSRLKQGRSSCEEEGRASRTTPSSGA